MRKLNRLIVAVLLTGLLITGMPIAIASAKPVSPGPVSAGTDRGLTVPVSGTFSPSTIAGPLSALGSGSFAGTFTIRSFEVVDGRLVAVGNLVITVKDTSGNPIRSVNIGAVSIPVDTSATTVAMKTESRALVAAESATLRTAGDAPVSVETSEAAAINGRPGVLRAVSVVQPLLLQNRSCQILHLELGPLSLDLLGLQINLNRIVLDITAQQGSGNLLGNLLCAIANLLNPTGSLTLLANLLNQLLQALASL